MKIALEEASKAQWPFGAVVVSNGKIISQAGSGDSYKEFDPTAHAEVNAIRGACEKLKTKDLADAVLYTSCEPCALCFGTAWYANIKKIIYGTSLEEIKHINKKWGGDLGFPYDHKETGIQISGGLLRGEIMDMYMAHPGITKELSREDEE